MASPPLVSIHQVGKVFATVHAVDNISFSVQRGEVFALLGPNGAGKSTLVRMLIGMLDPDHGRIVWHDKDGAPVRMQRSQIGYLPEDRGLYKSEPTRRILQYFGELRGMRPSAALNAANHWLERLGMQDHAKCKLETLSKGNQQKIQIAAAVLHNPTLAILDEPFSGLDPLNQELMLELIAELKASGMTILLSAHQLNLVERMADHVLLMARGREVLSGTIADVKRGPFGGRSLELHFADEFNPSDLELLASDSDIVRAESIDGKRLRLTLHSNASITGWISRASKFGEIESLNSSELTLHEIYLRALGAPNTSDIREEVQI